METLSYLHITLNNEEPTDTNYTLAVNWKNPKLLTWLSSPQLSTRAAIPVVSLTIALGILGMARQALALAKPGERSAEVTSLQLRLQRLGYFKAKATGYYGPLTKQAVMNYQQAKGLAPDGIAGPSTQATLTGYQEQAREESAQPIWKIGDRGAKVSDIQKTLAEAGYPSSTNGTFDAPTAEAVRLFQQARGLKVDGIVGKETLTALSQKPQSQTFENSSIPEPTNQLTPEPTNQLTPEPEKTIRWESIEAPESSITESTTKSLWKLGDRDVKVSEIQNRLTAAGFPSGTKGVFDTQTQKAVRQFQQARGLDVDGIVGDETLTALSDNSKTESKPEPKVTTPWYEDKSVPLAPFTR